MRSENSGILRRWFEEVWNQGRDETIEELFPEDGVIHDGLNSITGPKEFRIFYDRMRGAFSGIYVELHDELNTDDRCCIRFTAHMTHTGEGMDHPPTGKRLTATGISMARCSDGKLVEAWQNWDMLGLIHQMRDEAPAKTYMTAVKSAGAEA